MDWRTAQYLENSITSSKFYPNFNEFQKFLKTRAFVTGGHMEGRASKHSKEEKTRFHRHKKIEKIARCKYR